MLADVEESLQSVCQLKQLRHLDVSQSTKSWGHLRDPTQFLETLVTSLPALQSLDISGTNLAGPRPDRAGVCPIPGLTSRYGPLTLSQILRSSTGRTILWSSSDCTRHTQRPAAGTTSQPASSPGTQRRGRSWWRAGDISTGPPSCRVSSTTW